VREMKTGLWVFVDNDGGTDVIFKTPNFVLSYDASRNGVGRYVVGFTPITQSLNLFGSVTQTIYSSN